MGRVGQFVRRHWLGILSLAGVGVAVATGFATRRYGASAPRRPQRASNSAWGSVTAIANTVARNGQSIAIGYVARQTPTLPVPTED